MARPAIQCSLCPGSLVAHVMGRGADLAAVALPSFENWFGSTFSSRILKESNVLGKRVVICFFIFLLYILPSKLWQ